ncbi:hypothetical protein ACJIZ3_012316 [Penstemon smallii]|uniref:Pentatricopeptide repeat-containing protein n=1 Tax=Penstemon smallii TaxID=265156 RepID=A0ABD3ULQ5_9LAMI
MLLRAIRLQALPLKTHNFRALQSISLLSSLPNSDPLNDTVHHISTLLKKPNWQNNIRLKSFVSHMNPHLVSKIIAFHSHDIPLSLNFSKWVCKQSTYCYDIDSRINLLYLLVSDNLYGIVHKVLVFLIKECFSSKTDILKLIDAIDDMEKIGFRINYPCYSMLLMCLMKLDMGLMTFMVFKRMVEGGFVVDGIDYRTIVNALCKNGFVQAAEMFVSRVLKLGFELDVYVCTSLVLGNCRAGDLSEAFRVFELMSKEDGCGVNSVTFSILIHGLCEVGRLDEACKSKENMSVKGFQPSVRTYTILIKAMCDNGLVNKACSLFDEMIGKGCKPNVHTYTVMIDMLCKEVSINEANGMFRKMLKDGLYPSIVTYNALINGYCKEGRVVSAFELLGLMERRHCKPNIRTYNELFDGLCKIGKPHKAVTLLRKVINNGISPTEVTFNILIDGFCRVGEVAMAIEILRSMNSIGIKPDKFSYTGLIDGLCKMGKPEKASVFLGVMVKEGVSLDEVTLTTLIHGYCKIGKTKDGLVLFVEMIKNGCMTSPHIFNIFLDIISKEVKLVEENAILGKMIKYGLVPSVVTYTILVDGLCKRGDINSSLEMLESMRQVGCRPNVYAYTTIINCLCKFGKVEEAGNLFIEMQKDAVLPNEIIYGLLVKSYVAAGRLNLAFEILNTMSQNGCKPSSQIYLALLSGILKSEMEGSSRIFSPRFVFKDIDISHAIKLREKFVECGGHLVDIYNFLILGLSRVGRISESEYLIQEMVKNGLYPDSDVCASIIDHFYKSHDYDLCLEWIRRFLGYGCIFSFASYCPVIVGLQSEGRFSEADRLISDLLKDADVENQNAITPYIDFLVKGEEPCEILSFIEKIGHRERPVI